MLTNRAWELLRIMAREEADENWDDAEIVCEGITCYLGGNRTSQKTVNNLIEHCCVSECSDEGSTLHRYRINGTGKAALEDQSVPDKVRLALLRGIPVDERGDPLPA